MFDNSGYVQFTINQTCNIWRSHSNAYGTYTSIMHIYKLINSTFVDISSNYNQVAPIPTLGVWTKCIIGLNPGTYKFIANGRSDDVEWYLEKVGRFLIQDGNNICSTNGTDLQIKSNLPYTENLFNDFDIDLPNVNSNFISLINNNKYNIAMLK